MKAIINRFLRKKSEPIKYGITYAQSGEDVIVDFVFKHILLQEKITYLDIGAHHSTYLSNTALFYNKGSYGVCVEPDPILYSEIKLYRPNDICLNVGIGFSSEENKSEELEFFIMSSRTLNTFSKEEAERLHNEGTYKIVDRKKIPVVHIHALFKKYNLPDFLSIDVEGIDFEILKSIDFSKYRPKVLCIETAEFSPIPPGKKKYDSIDYLKERNYLVYADTFNNTIFIDNEYLTKLYQK